MLSLQEARIPRKVTIRVARAENLKATYKSAKKKYNNKFKVTVLGGKDKESSDISIGSNDAVHWKFTCTIKLHKNQKDPLAILVEDSDGNHKGQVIIPIVKIPPKPEIRVANQDPTTSTNILCSELEPTNKCSDASGYLYYWMWVEEYLSQEADSSRKSFNKSVSSLFGSKSRLSGSKTHLEVKNPDSVRQFGSVSNLNPPEKHKKSSSLLKLNFSGKKKPKPSVAQITPDSSDTESSLNFTANHDLSKGDPNAKIRAHTLSKSSMSSKLDIPVPIPEISSSNFNQSNKKEPINNYENFVDPKVNLTGGGKTEQSDMSYGNPFSKRSPKSEIPDSPPETLFSKASNFKDQPQTVSNEPVNKDDSYLETKFTFKTPNNSNPFNTLPRGSPLNQKESFSSSDSYSNSKYSNNAVPSLLPTKMFMNLPDTSTTKDPFYNDISSTPHQNDNDFPSRSTHGHSKVGSDYSLFNERGNHLPQPNNKANNEELENLRKENSELKDLNIKYQEKIKSLQSNLEADRMALAKLRSRLLAAGEIQFLEIN